MRGFWKTGMRGLGKDSVRGRRRVPRPAPRMNAVWGGWDTVGDSVRGSGNWKLNLKRRLRAAGELCGGRRPRATGLALREGEMWLYGGENVWEGGSLLC